METSNRTTRSNSIHYNDVYTRYENALKKYRDERAITEVTQYLLQNFSQKQLSALDTESQGGLENRIQKLGGDLNAMMRHGIVVQIIATCAGINTPYTQEIQKVALALQQGDLYLAIENAKRISPQNPQRNETFITLTKLSLGVNILEKAKETVHEISSEEKTELLGYLKLMEKSPRDFSGFVIQMKCGIESIKSMKSAMSNVGEGLKSLTIEELQKYKAQKSSETLHIAPASVIYAEEIEAGQVQLKNEPPTTYEALVVNLIDSIIRAKQTETILELLGKDKPEAALDIANKMDRQSKITTAAYLKIVDYYKNRGHILTASSVLSHMADGDAKKAKAIELIRLSTQNVSRTVENEFGIPMPSNSQINGMVTIEKEKAEMKMQELSKLSLKELQERKKTDQELLETYRLRFVQAIKSKNETSSKEAMDLKFDVMNELILIEGLLKQKESEAVLPIQENKASNNAEEIKNMADSLALECTLEELNERLKSAQRDLERRMNFYNSRASMDKEGIPQAEKLVANGLSYIAAIKLAIEMKEIENKSSLKKEESKEFKSAMKSSETKNCVVM